MQSQRESTGEARIDRDREPECSVLQISGPLTCQYLLTMLEVLQMLRQRTRGRELSTGKGMGDCNLDGNQHQEIAHQKKHLEQVLLHVAAMVTQLEHR